MEFRAARTSKAGRDASLPNTTSPPTEAMKTAPVPESSPDLDPADCSLPPDAPLTHSAMADYMNQVITEVHCLRKEVDALRRDMSGRLETVSEGVTRLESDQADLPQSLTDLIVNDTGIRQRRNMIATIREEMMWALNTEEHQELVSSHNALGGVQVSLSDVGQHIDAILKARKDYISSATMTTGDVKRKKDFPPLPTLLQGVPSDASMLLRSKEYWAMAIIGTVLTCQVKMRQIVSTVYGDLVMKISNAEIKRENVASALLRATGIDLRTLVESENSGEVEHADDVDENEQVIRGKGKRKCTETAKGRTVKSRKTAAVEKVTVEKSSMHLDFSTVKKPLTLAMIHVAIREAMHWARIKANLVPLADQANKAKITSSCAISLVALVFYIDQICRSMGINIDTPCMPQLRSASEQIVEAANRSGFFGPDFSYEKLVERLLVPTKARLPITQKLEADIVTCDQDGGRPTARGGQTDITSFLKPPSNNQ